MVNVATTCECGEELVCMCNVGAEPACDSCIECGCDPDVCRCDCHNNDGNEMFKSQRDFE